MKPIFLEYFWKHNFTNKWKNFGIWESEFEKILHYYRGRSRTEYFTLRPVFAD